MLHIYIYIYIYIYNISSLRVNNILYDLAIISRSGLLADSPTTETRIAIVSILFLSHVTVADWLRRRGKRGKTQKYHMLCDPGSFQMQSQYQYINYFSQLTVTLHTDHALFSPNAPLRSTLKCHWIANWHQWGTEVILIILKKDDKILLSVPFAFARWRVLDLKFLMNPFCQTIQNIIQYSSGTLHIMHTWFVINSKPM